MVHGLPRSFTGCLERFSFLSVVPAGGVCVASEPKEDCVHFLVLTDVCGNRTYGVVAQYYRPLHVGGSIAALGAWGDV
jgi:hypothetical protein